MNWEQAHYNYYPTNGQPPTPIKTPTSATFECSFFQTPKIESSFHDPRVTWDAAHQYPTSPVDLNTPSSNVVTSNSPVTVNQQNGVRKPDIDATLASHVHHRASNPLLSLPPVEPSRQLSSSPGPGSAKRSLVQANDSFDGQENNIQTGNSFHTPPSTDTPQRHSILKQSKSFSSFPMAESRSFSTSNPSQMGPPETPNRFVEASPQFFPTLQFSPDLFQTHMLGPATAPIYPQQRLFWDPNSGGPDGAATATQYRDHYIATNNGLVSPFTPSPVPSHGFQNAMPAPGSQVYDLPSSQEQQIMAVSSSPFVDGAVFPAPFTASPRVPPNRADDPGLFLSSPARRFGKAPPPSNPLSSNGLGERQPYHHQMAESKREEELERAKRSKANRPGASVQLKGLLRRPSSPAVEPRPELQRSSTHSGIAAHQARLRRKSQVSFSESVSVANGGSRQLSHGGRSSPLHVNSGGAFQTPRLKTRTSLTFTIDKDGRAKTLVTKLPELVDTPMALDEESSGSDAEFADVGEYDMTRSQQNSFALPEQDANLLSPDRLNAEQRPSSKTSSYSSTAESINAGLHSLRQGSLKGGPKLTSTSPEIYSGPSRHNIGNPRRDLAKFYDAGRNAASEDETSLGSDEEKGDAQHALRAIVKDRPRANMTQMGNFSTRPTGPPPQFLSSPPNGDNVFNTYNTSPTTITDPDLGTPSTGMGSYASSGNTRCVCNSSSADGEFMIQCESCSNWLHAKCVGIDGRRIPPVYVCIYCAQTPMRHGRVREPSRAAALAPASPLAHKSQRYR